MFSPLYPSITSNVITRCLNFLDFIKFSLDFTKSKNLHSSFDFLIKEVKYARTTVCFGNYTKEELYLLKKVVGRSGSLILFVTDNIVKNKLLKISKLMGWLNVVIEFPGSSGTTPTHAVTKNIAQKEAIVNEINNPNPNKISSSSLGTPIKVFCKSKLIQADLLTIRVKGGDTDILKTTEKILETCKPVVILEFSSKAIDKTSFFKAAGFFASKNYKGFFILDTLKIPLQNFDFDIYQNPRSNFYCNTFVFEQR